MTGYLCATPYHIMAAITMASGMFKDEPSTLIVMDHFAADESFTKKIESLEIFDKVILYKSNNKTKLNNLKRLVNAFVPPKTVKALAKTDFSRFVCFALNFIDVTYLIKKFEKRGVNCEFAYGDDGLGSYLNDRIYKPKKISETILRINGRLKLLEKIEKLYVYKPEYVVENKNYLITKIEQSNQTTKVLTKAARTLWPLDNNVDFDGKILHFEQPYAEADEQKIVKKEQALLKLIMEKSKKESCIKMHPRSFGDKNWSEFDVLESKIPFEAMLLQKECKPAFLTTNFSTAAFSTYLFDGLSCSECQTILFNNILKNGNENLSKLLKVFSDVVNNNLDKNYIHLPSSEKELIQIAGEI